MRIYKSGLIGHDLYSTKSFWNTGDDSKRLEENLKVMPSDWYYKTTPIIYNINSNGHRSKELNELDTSNYILCIGCSHTEGIGVEENKTYPAVLAKKLNCDYYNLGLGATGIDVLVHNLLVWFATVDEKPKAVVIQWPIFTRVLTGKSSNNLKPVGFWENDDDFGKFVNLGIDLEYFDAKKILVHNLIKQTIKVPVINLCLTNTMPIDSQTLLVKPVDKARDLSHPGIESHQIFAESVYDALINTGCLNFYQNTEQKS